MHEKILVKILRCGLYAVAFVPLVIFSQFLSPFHFGKAVIFRSLIEILSIVYLMLIIRDPRYLPPRTKIFWTTTLFTIVYAVTSLTGVDWHLSVWGSLERMGGLYSFVHFWLFFVIATAIFRTKKDWLDYIRISIFVSLLGAVYGFLQKTNATWIIGAGGRNKIFGTQGNSALFAGYQLVNLFWALIFYFKSGTSEKGKWFYGSAVIINTLAVFLAGVRGSALAVFVGVVVFVAWYGFALGSARIRRFAVSGIIAFLIFVAAIVVFRSSSIVSENQYLDRFSDLSLKTLTVQTRTWTWISGLRGWLETPKTILLGWGPENYDIPFVHYFDPRHFRSASSETLFDRAHNMFIEALVTMGVVGEIAYLLFLGLPLYLLIKFVRQSKQKLFAKDPLAREQFLYGVGLVSLLVAYGIHNMFIFDTTANYLVFFTTLGLIGVILFPEHLTLPQAVSTPNSKSLALAVGLIATVPVVLLIYFFNIKPAQANYAATRAIILSWAKKKDEAIQQFKKALSYNATIDYDLRNRFAQYLIDIGSGTLDENTKAALLFGIDEEKKSIAQRPEDYIPYLYASRIYILLGKGDSKSPYNDEALKYSAEALKISPTFVRTYFEVAQAYLNKGDVKNAIGAFQKAASLNPATSISWWYLGLAQLQDQDATNGSQSLKKAFELGYQPNETEFKRAIALFIQMKDYPAAILAYKGLTALRPENPQYHASLAALYAQKGDLDAAVAEARAAVKADPKFEPDARAFLKQIGREL